MEEAIRAGQEDGCGDKRFAGAEALACELARGIDEAAVEDRTYVIAQLAPRLLDVLIALRLTPMYLADPHNPIMGLFRDLSATDAEVNASAEAWRA